MGKGGRAKAGSAKPDSISARRERMHACNRSSWAKRHPQRAAEERAFRKERAELLDGFSHKRNGTPETHYHAGQMQQGAIMRLYVSGCLSIEDVAAAAQIRAVAERIARDVTVRTASLETRVDTSRHGDAFFESLGAVWNEMTYSRWRSRIGANAALVMDIVVRDSGLARAAATHQAHPRRVRRLLREALEEWTWIHAMVRREVSSADLVAAHAGIL
ncbi:hypothetical protein ACFFV8_12235 [Sphingobium indicum]|nr:hypothetical protein [Sphingobium sp. HDIP04]